jgi:hypothetical protein
MSIHWEDLEAVQREYTGKHGNPGGVSWTFFVAKKVSLICWWYLAQKLYDYMLLALTTRLNMMNLQYCSYNPFLFDSSSIVRLCVAKTDS